MHPICQSLFTVPPSYNKTHDLYGYFLTSVLFLGLDTMFTQEAKRYTKKDTFWHENFVN